MITIAAVRRERVGFATVFPGVSIDKESTGVPEVNVHRRTTKVNLGIIAGVTLFFVAMAGVVYWLSRWD